MSDDEVDIHRVVRALIPVRAKQAHAVPERPYRPNGPWPVDRMRHRRVELDEPDDEMVGATVQSNMRELPYQCRLCDQRLSDDQLDFHNCQGEQ